MKLTLKQWNLIVDTLSKVAERHEKMAKHVDETCRKGDWEFVSKEAEELYRDNREKANEINRILDSINEQLI